MPNAESCTYRPLGTSDIANAIELWERTPGIGLSSADEPSSLARFLLSNEGLCWCAVSVRELVGTALCGSDGRRGYLYHVAVADESRRAGVGSTLVSHVLESLRAMGIRKCHAMVFAQNESGRTFWKETDWKIRDELVVFSRELE